MGDLIARQKNIVNGQNIQGWRYSETIADGVTSSPVKIKPNINGLYAISVALIAGSGTGKIQYTLDSEAAIDGSTATWFDWNKGDVTGDNIDAFISPVSGIRCVSSSGAMTFKILI